MNSEMRRKSCCILVVVLHVLWTRLLRKERGLHPCRIHRTKNSTACHYILYSCINVQLASEKTPCFFSVQFRNLLHKQCRKRRLPRWMCPSCIKMRFKLKALLSDIIEARVRCDQGNRVFRTIGLYCANVDIKLCFLSASRPLHVETLEGLQQGYSLQIAGSDVPNVAAFSNIVCSQGDIDLSGAVTGR